VNEQTTKEAPAEAPIGRKRARREKTLALHTPWHDRILAGLRGKPIYEGIDPDLDPARANRLQKRRAKNRVAAKSRRINRSR